MQSTLPKRSRLLEFCVLAAVIAVCGVVLLRVVAGVQQEAERLAVELTIRNINSGMELQQADRIMAGRENTLGELMAQNPVSWLRTPPDGYVGEGRCDERLLEGQWAWDVSRKTLNYRPKQANWLGGQAGNPCLTWRVLSRHHQTFFRPGSHRFQPALDAPATTSLPGQ